MFVSTLTTCGARFRLRKPALTVGKLAVKLCVRQAEEKLHGLPPCFLMLGNHCAGIRVSETEFVIFEPFLDRLRTNAEKIADEVEAEPQA